MARHASSSTQGAPSGTPTRRAQVPQVTAHARAAVTRPSLCVVAHWFHWIRVQGVPVVRARQLGSSRQTSADGACGCGCCAEQPHRCSQPIASSLAMHLAQHPVMRDVSQYATSAPHLFTGARGSVTVAARCARDFRARAARELHRSTFMDRLDIRSTA